MDIKAELKWIHKELDTIQDPLFIEVIKNLLKFKNKVTTEEISIEQYNKELDAAIERVKKGEFYTQEEAEKIMDSW